MDDWKVTLEKTEVIARKAGEIVLDYFKKPREHTMKGEFDVATEADHVAEEYIVNALKEGFPDYTIVSEEGSSYSPGKGASDYYWYVDPIDGTTNFAHRMPHFCVSIGLAGIDRHPVVGVIYDPVRDECFTAAQGTGAFLNGERIEISKTSELKQGLVSTGFPADRKVNPDNNLKEFNAMLLRAQGVRRTGAAALEMAYVAAARYDGFWENKLNLWDCAAGIILVKEAGGNVTDYRGGDHMLYQKRPQVLATNGLIHEEMSIVLVTAR